MNENKGRMWGVLVHLGMNQWRDHVQEMKPKGCWSRVPEVILRHMSEQYCAADHVRFDEAVWREVSAVYAREGVNTIVLDLGEAVAYPSHPELAVRGSWSVGKLRAELARLRGMGFEVIPKLNFSSTHDAWLGDYHRMLSTPDYYRVCSDVIRDVCEMFGGPRLFHIGFDEERASSRDRNAMIVVRQGELWWHDLLFMIGEVEKHGARPMMWVDYLVKESDRSGVFGRLPKSVLVQPWYYEDRFDEKTAWEVGVMRSLDAHGYEMVPCGSEVFFFDDNFGLLVDYCERNLDRSRIPGYMIAPWLEMAPWAKDRLVHAGETLGKVRRKLESS